MNRLPASLLLFLSACSASQTVPEPSAESFDDLEGKNLRSAVQFSDATSSNAPEDSFIESLRAPSLEERLNALAVLIHARAPRSIEEQWSTLRELESASLPAREGALLRELRAAFDADSLVEFLERAEPSDRYDDDTQQQWALRAAGLLDHRTLLPRVIALATSKNLGSSLAAERALEDYSGPEAEAGLVACIRAWNYNAYVRAARALLRRNPALLEECLLTLEVPEDSRYQRGLFLGRLGNPHAVPDLIASVGGIAIKDREMFDLIEALSTEEHRSLIVDLPEVVRDSQRERAEQVKRSVLTRLD